MYINVSAGTEKKCPKKYFRINVRNIMVTESAWTGYYSYCSIYSFYSPCLGTVVNICRIKKSRHRREEPDSCEMTDIFETRVPRKVDARFNHGLRESWIVHFAVPDWARIFPYIPLEMWRCRLPNMCMASENIVDVMLKFHVMLKRYFTWLRIKIITSLRL